MISGGLPGEALPPSSTSQRVKSSRRTNTPIRLFERWLSWLLKAPRHLSFPKVKETTAKPTQQLAVTDEPPHGLIPALATLYLMTKGWSLTWHLGLR